MESRPVFPRKPVLLLAIGILICLLVMIFFSGCKKNFDTEANNFITEQSTRFFELPADAPPEAQVVATAMRQQLSAENVNDFISWHGQPVWARVIKLNPAPGGPATYIIPVSKADGITAFLGATVVSANKVLFELHRTSSQLSGAKEFTYAGITAAKSGFFLNYFEGKPAEATAPAAKNSLSSSSLDYCWWEAVVVPCHAFANTDSVSSLVGIKTKPIPPVCFNWIEHCDPIDDGDEPGGGGGGGGGEPGGGGGNGGGNGGEQCPLWYSLLPPVDPCWPTEPPKDPPLDSNAIKSLLKKEQQDIKRMRDSIWNEAFVKDEEWHFFIKVVNGVSQIKAERTDHLKDAVSHDPKFAAIGNPDGDWHTHKDHPSPAYRHLHDPQDICVSNGLFRKLYYRNYVDCGDTLYVVVTEDLALVKKFFNSQNIMAKQFDTSWTNLSTAGAKRREKGIQRLKELLGKSTTSGLGLYKTTDADRTVFIKLN